MRKKTSYTSNDSIRSKSGGKQIYNNREMLGVLPVCSPGVLLTLYGNKFEKEPVVGPLKLYIFFKLVSTKG